MITIWLDIMWWDSEVKWVLWTDVRLNWAIEARNREKELRVFVYWTQEAVDSIIVPNVSIWRITPIITEVDSSMKKMINDIKEWKIDWWVSAWETWELIKKSLLLWRLDKEWDVKWFTPALTWFLPHISWRQTLMLDLWWTAKWFNSDEHMERVYLNNALLAISYYRVHHWWKNPKIWILNIWSEPSKWPKWLQWIYNAFLEKFWKDIFIWNIEWSDLLTTEADIIITDWFTWNMVLKTLEWTVRAVWKELKTWIEWSKLAKFWALFLLPLVKRFKTKYNPDLYSWAPILWVDWILLKSHWSSSQEAITQALLKAYYEAKNWRLAETKVNLKALMKEFSD